MGYERRSQDPFGALIINMKPLFWTTLLALALVLITASCAPAITITPLPPVVLDVAGTTLTKRVKASAVVVPAQETKLSFSISGLIKEVNIREGDFVKKGQPLLTLDMSEQEFGLEAAESALYSAEVHAQLQRIRNKQFIGGKLVYLSGPREQILVADAKVEQKRALLEVAKAALAQGTIIAPFSGTVVEINISSGEYAQTSQGVIILATLQDLQVETTDLSELNIASVEKSQTAIIFIKALNQEYTGEVTSISPISETIGGTVVFRTILKLDKKPKGLLWGMSAEVEIFLE